NDEISDRYFLLCGASNLIPLNVEDFEDFKIILIFKNRPNEVIAVEGVSKKGQDLLGFNYDKSIVVPYNFYVRNFSDDDNQTDKTVEVHIRPGESMDELKNELIALMRSSKKLRPKQDDNFSLNELSVIAKGFDGLFSGLDIVGLIIGGLAALVGGFGIANIMFVSVSERKAVIGIKKALGARRRDILTEFLLESVFLCLIGGAIGLLLVYLLAIAATNGTGMEFTLNLKNSLIAIFLSIILGILSGIIPAFLAAKLDPVEAIRSK
ncbi:MAG TPA: FtsX-like permease family protein, partial [Chitinophagales bacterium]|nr:FtsX-like permease family protein [Chitinophagales bacterium]